jgi:hypothetical protein
MGMNLWNQFIRLKFKGTISGKLDILGLRQIQLVIEQVQTYLVPQK